MNILALLQEMDASLEEDHQGDLALGWRLRLWSAIKKQFGDEADFRRNVLAYLVAREVLPLWNRCEFEAECPKEKREVYRRHPEHCLELCKLYLQGSAVLSAVKEALDAMYDDGNDACYYLVDSSLSLAYGAVRQLALRFSGEDDEIYEDREWYGKIWVGSQHLEIRDTSFGEMEWCETHYAAADAATFVDGGDIYSPSPEDFAKRRRFWRSWLRETVPKVLGPIEKVRSLLDSP